MFCSGVPDASSFISSARVIAGAFYPVLLSIIIKKFRRAYEIKLTSNKINGDCGSLYDNRFISFSTILYFYIFYEEWSNAVEPLQILSFLIVLQSLNIAIADGLTTSGRQNKRTVVQCIALVIGGIMLYSFSSIGGVIGAAYAMVLFEIVALVGYIAVSVVRKKIVFQIVIPYTIYFGVTFIGVQYMLHTYHFIALVLNTLIVVVGIFLYDYELKNFFFVYNKNTQKGLYYETGDIAYGK